MGSIVLRLCTNIAKQVLSSLPVGPQNCHKKLLFVLTVAYAYRTMSRLYWHCHNNPFLAWMTDLSPAYAMSYYCAPIVASINLARFDPI
jgi:hypothetical protein